MRFRIKTAIWLLYACSCSHLPLKLVSVSVPLQHGRELDMPKPSVTSLVLCCPRSRLSRIKSTGFKVRRAKDTHSLRNPDRDISTAADQVTPSHGQGGVLELAIVNCGVTIPKRGLEVVRSELSDGPGTEHSPDL